MTEAKKEKRQKIYTTIEHLNAAVNILRALGLANAADQTKEIIRRINAHK